MKLLMPLDLDGAKGSFAHSMKLTANSTENSHEKDRPTYSYGIDDQR
jgi:hypothetical protein